MALLQLPMPPVVIAQNELALFGQRWIALNQRLSRTPPQSSDELGGLFERSVAGSLTALLGNLPIVYPNRNALIPPQPDCVEVGEVRVIGGVRPQNFDVVYRPDGVRFAFDAKTLNDLESVKKNWQNMINDLATEATTVHSRFPYGVVAFLVAIPAPCLQNQQAAMIETLERLGRRVNINDPVYQAETISLALWNPEDGSISNTVPPSDSPLRIEKFSSQVESAYVSRYKGLPPHAAEPRFRR